MGTMIALVKQLQVIVHLVLLKVILPSNTEIMFAYLIGILTFDPIDISDQVTEVFGLDDKVVSAPRFDALDYSSPYMVTNLGSMTIVIFVFVLAIAMFALCSKCPAKCAKVKLFGSN